MATALPEVTVHLMHDTEAEKPRMWDNHAMMVWAHRRYILGHEDRATEAHDVIYVHVSVRQLDEKGFDTTHVADIHQALIMTGMAIILPLYLFVHSAITKRTNPFACPCDSGQVGLIYVSMAKVSAELGWNRLNTSRTVKVTAMLDGVVELYDHYLTGDVSGFMVIVDGVETDTCWGYYGSVPHSNGVVEHHAGEAEQLVEAGQFQRFN
ncbi:hypothetical protein [Pseudomonas aeruginosa]|uniref:hypothetical protein n=1 Tax=Pseudomonas aeruginosa TaxID=287 RepID=UPI001E3C2B41|nr:hypothetical protein [Pseudomonas aeruginosa]MCC9289612.1 hypothetical protein [Pseudomonas aeruginosa]UVN18860.1 Hypothetical protein [Pseudomonas aeruginosa]